MPNIEHIKKYKNVHMIGIGGISMSGIAAIPIICTFLYFLICSIFGIKNI